MSQILLYLDFIILIIALTNFATIRIPKNDKTVKKSVSVIVPMRDEAENVHEFIQALAGQQGLSDYAIIIINDSSSDKTLDFLRQATSGDSRFSIIDSPTLRQGWLGKVSALQYGYEACSSEIIVTLDADVRLKANALMRAANQLDDLALDFVSPYPRQIAVTWSEKLIQPILHWSWMSTVILRLSEKFPRRSTAVANGQFFVVRKAALDDIGGFSSVQRKILDDIELARALIAAGYKGVVTEGSEIASTRMYGSFSEIQQGYGKSLWKAFGGPVGSVLAAIFIFATGVAPVIFLLNGYFLGLILYFYIVLTREISALRSRTNPMYAFMHPISSLLIIYLLGYSWIKRGSIQWKGRTV